MNNKIKTIDLQLISSIIFLITVIVSITITYDEKLKQDNKKNIYTNNEALYLSLYNRLIILISILISLYVSITNLKNTNTERGKYKSSLLLFTNILTLISALILLYVAYLNKEENTLTPAGTQNTLI